MLQADPQADQEEHHHHGLHPAGTCHHVAVGCRSDPWLFVKLRCLRFSPLQRLFDQDGRDDDSTSTQWSALS